MKQKSRIDIFQGELDGLMRQHPHLVHPRQQQQMYSVQQQPPHHHPVESQNPRAGQYHQHHSVESGMPSTKQHKRIGGAYLSQQRSFSSSEEDLRSTPDFDGELSLAMLLFTRRMCVGWG